MYRCVLAPVDGSDFGEHALPLAASVARAGGAALHLAHVHVPPVAASEVEILAFRGPWFEVARAGAQVYLDGVAERVERAYGARVHAALLDGSVAESLARYAADCGADLVVMSTHAHRRLRRLWHQGVADHLNCQLGVPVLLVRPPEGEPAPDLARHVPLGHLLVPLDGSECAESVLEHVTALARISGARLTLLRVDEAAAGDPAARAAALQYVNAVAERLRALGLEVRARAVTAADPAAAIVACARGEGAEPADLIAIGCHPHGTVSRLLGSCLDDEVLAASPVPVLLFRRPGARPADDGPLDLPVPPA